MASFVTHAEFVYCAVRAASLNVIQVNFRIQGGRATAQAGLSPQRPD